MARQRTPKKSATDRYADNQARADELLAKGDDVSLAERDRLLADNEDHERGGQEESAPDPTPPAPAGDSMRWKGGGTQVSAIVLGFFAWVWVVLPAIKPDPTTKAPGGATAVRTMLKAKFLNLGADGQPL